MSAEPEPAHRRSAFAFNDPAPQVSLGPDLMGDDQDLPRRALIENLPDVSVVYLRTSTAAEVEAYHLDGLPADGQAGVVTSPGSLPFGNGSIQILCCDDVLVDDMDPKILHGGAHGLTARHARS